MKTTLRKWYLSPVCAMLIAAMLLPNPVAANPAMLRPVTAADENYTDMLDDEAYGDALAAWSYPNDEFFPLLAGGILAGDWDADTPDEDAADTPDEDADTSDQDEVDTPDQDAADMLDTLTFAPASGWNYPDKHYLRCPQLKRSPAPVRYEDGTPIGSSYIVSDALRLRCQGRTRHGIALDARELLSTPQGKIYFHWAGAPYTNAPLNLAYGHLLMRNLQNPPKPLVRNHPPGYGAPSYQNGQWDWRHRNGRQCSSVNTLTSTFTISITGTTPIDPTWQYKKGEHNSRYNKYASAGVEQGDYSANYAYLVWSWLTEGNGVDTHKGGGIVRALLEDNQPFYACGVTKIDSLAYAPDSATVVGHVSAIYGKTRATPSGPWVYGWAVYAHQAIGEMGWHCHMINSSGACPDQAEWR